MFLEKLSREEIEEFIESIGWKMIQGENSICTGDVSGRPFAVVMCELSAKEKAILRIMDGWLEGNVYDSHYPTHRILKFNDFKCRSYVEEGENQVSFSKEWQTFMAGKFENYTDELNKAKERAQKNQ